MSTITKILSGAILLASLVPPAFAQSMSSAGGSAGPAPLPILSRQEAAPVGLTGGKVIEASEENSIYAGPRQVRDEPGQVRPAGRLASSK